MAEVLVFEEDPIVEVEIPIRVQRRDYVMKRPVGSAAIKYQSARAAAIKYGSDGKPERLTDAGKLDPLLLSLCIFHKCPEDRALDGKLVSIKMIEGDGSEQNPGWEQKTIEALAKKAREIGCLEDQDTVEKLEKELAVIQRKLAKLKGDPDPLADSSTNTPGG